MLVLRRYQTLSYVKIAGVNVVQVEAETRLPTLNHRRPYVYYPKRDLFIWGAPGNVHPDVILQAAQEGYIEDDPDVFWGQYSIHGSYYTHPYTDEVANALHGRGDDVNPEYMDRIEEITGVRPDPNITAEMFWRGNNSEVLNVDWQPTLSRENPVSYDYVPLLPQELEGEYAGKYGKMARRYNARARKMGAPGLVSGRELYALAKRYDDACAYCGQPYGQSFPETLSFDHIQALARGGSNTIDNLLPVHAKCNNDMGNWDDVNNPVQRRWEDPPEDYEAEDRWVAKTADWEPMQQEKQHVPYEPPRFDEGWSRDYPPVYTTPNRRAWKMNADFVWIGAPGEHHWYHSPILDGPIEARALSGALVHNPDKSVSPLEVPKNMTHEASAALMEAYHLMEQIGRNRILMDRKTGKPVFEDYQPPYGWYALPEDEPMRMEIQKRLDSRIDAQNAPVRPQEPRTGSAVDDWTPGMGEEEQDVRPAYKWLYDKQNDQFHSYYFDKNDPTWPFHAQISKMLELPWHNLSLEEQKNWITGMTDVYPNQGRADSRVYEIDPDFKAVKHVENLLRDRYGIIQHTHDAKQRPQWL